MNSTKCRHNSLVLNELTVSYITYYEQGAGDL